MRPPRYDWDGTVTEGTGMVPDGSPVFQSSQTRSKGNDLSYTGSPAATPKPGSVACPTTNNHATWIRKGVMTRHEGRTARRRRFRSAPAALQQGHRALRNHPGAPPR